MTFADWIKPLIKELEIETDKWRDKNINTKAQVVVLSRSALLTPDKGGKSVLTADLKLDRPLREQQVAQAVAMKKVKDTAKEWIQSTRPGKKDKDALARKIKILNLDNMKSNRFHYVVTKDWAQSASLFKKFKTKGLMRKGMATHRGHEDAAVSLQGDAAIQKLKDTFPANVNTGKVREQNAAFKVAQLLKASLQAESDKLTPTLSARSKYSIKGGTKDLAGEVVLLIPETDLTNLSKSEEKGHRVRMLKIAKQFLADYGHLLINISGSRTFLNALSSRIDAHIRGKKSKPYKKSNSIKYKGKNKKVKNPKVKIAVLPRTRLRDKKGRFTSPLNIQALLQSRISTQVAENMGEAGALEYRTGRFSESVVIMKVTRQKVLTAYYTYMKYPYQTFERGFAQGSLRRDPRVLISKSIREIAAGVINERFNIRRV